MKKQSATKTFFKIFGILLLTILVISITYISIFVSTPLKMKEYTLTNGEQTIVFQEMVHIGETDFYKQVEENLENYRKLSEIEKITFPSLQRVGSKPPGLRPSLAV